MAALRSKPFLITESSTDYEICCKLCPSAWALGRKGASHPGNVLSLLNHAAGHEAGKSRP
jgi:hypothetical protein